MYQGHKLQSLTQDQSCLGDHSLMTFNSVSRSFRESDPTLVDSTINPSDSHSSNVVLLSGCRVLFGCAVAAVCLFFLGRFVVLPTWLLATEVFTTVISLFLFGSFKYQIHKNAITYGMLLVILATFSGLSTSPWHEIGRAHV